MQQDVYELNPLKELQEPDIQYSIIDFNFVPNQLNTPVPMPKDNPILNAPYYYVNTKSFTIPRPLKVGHYYTHLEAVVILIKYADNPFQIFNDLPKTRNKKSKDETIKYELDYYSNDKKSFIHVNKFTMYSPSDVASDEYTVQSLVENSGRVLYILTR